MDLKLPQSRALSERRQIQNAVTKGRVRIIDLARAAGIPRSTLTGIADNDWNPRVDTLARLAIALKTLIAAPPPVQQDAPPDAETDPASETDTPPPLQHQKHLQS